MLILIRLQSENKDIYPCYSDHSESIRKKDVLSPLPQSPTFIGSKVKLFKHIGRRRKHVINKFGLKPEYVFLLPLIDRDMQVLTQ
jgi:hypothetical protein